MSSARKIKTIEDLTPDPRNANKGTERGAVQLENSLREYGAGRSIVATSDGVVLAGNKTLEQAASIGLPIRAVHTDGSELVVVVRDDLDSADPRAQELAIADNRVAEVDLAWDMDELKRELDEGIDLSKFWAEDELAAMLDIEPPEPPEDPGAQVDKADELQEVWQTERGQLWVIPSKTVKGKEHRLLCGDSTSEADVARVMGGEKAQLGLTDPPYGIGESYASYDDSEENLAGLIGRFVPIMRSLCDVVLLTPGNKNRHKYTNYDWMLCWMTPAGVGIGPWGFCCWQPILAYGKDPYLQRGIGSRPDALNATEGADNTLGHPCSKPVGVWKWIMERGSVSTADVVFDPFLGSGTTMVAAEQLGRLCYGIDICEKYVAVALQRLADMGLEPRKSESSDA